MLTKSDLNEIRNVVRGEVNEIVRNKLEAELKPIKKDLKGIKKSVNLIIDVFDKEIIGLRKKVNQIEEHLGI